MGEAQKVTLTGVSETALLTLNARANEARRPDRILDDPMAVRLVDSIDFDFAKFGTTRQDIPLRALGIDTQALRFLRQHPTGTVVALAEGLQTSFWRLSEAVPDPQFRWLTVDLPPIIAIRERLLPKEPRVSVCAQSALDYSWMDLVDTSDSVFITAEGLLMYLQPDEALGLIAECARRFPGGRMVFDLPPSWFGWLMRQGVPTSLRYRAPAMPFTLSAAASAKLVDTVPGVRAVHDLQLPPGRGLLFKKLLPAAYRLRSLADVRPSLTLLEFG
ncbi:methyltransferase [Mycolicibacter engbaekii]|uniref:Methyltransferase n=1 Tax=Mycolicibacter engbaekii TaxID=188915 RepID=A0A1X1TRN1_9MYCO|nr:class I SAM-dependent methyltransferase [Mycolicibacter engbaekii]ORV47257.1 methyltransferase [Mycolicibacter engbaekii]